MNMYYRELFDGWSFGEQIGLICATFIVWAILLTLYSVDPGTTCDSHRLGCELFLRLDS